MKKSHSNNHPHRIRATQQGGECSRRARLRTLASSADRGRPESPHCGTGSRAGRTRGRKCAPCAMMKALEKLVASKRNANVGNHAVMFYDIPNIGAALHILHIMQGATRAFSYHGNIICHVDDTRRRVYLTNCGWGTCSTTRALNDYRRYFVDGRGYELVEED